MSISALIKETRQKAFLSQEAFATILGVSVGTINRWENGKSKPNITAMKNLKKFCEINSLPFTEIEREWFSDKLEDAHS